MSLIIKVRKLKTPENPNLEDPKTPIIQISNLIK